MSQYEFDATLVFVAFAGEEQGLIGARAMAKRLKKRTLNDSSGLTTTSSAAR